MNTNEIVKALRDTDFHQDCDYCEHSDLCKGKDCAILQAADEIDRLQKELETAKADICNVLRDRMDCCDICKFSGQCKPDVVCHCSEAEWRGAV